MFTGLIEEVGVVKNVIRKNRGLSLRIECKDVLIKTQVGDSIAVNGVCLTVTKISKNDFRADVMEESLKLTTLSKFKSMQKLNLERALTLESRLGGHIVSGHVHGLGKLKKLTNQGFAKIYQFESTLTNCMTKKDSVAINGVSLTIIDVGSRHFSVSVIPETLRSTNLGHLKISDHVNIECEHYKEQTSGLSMGALRQMGF